MKKLLLLSLVAALFLGFTSVAQPNLEGLWKIESGKWDSGDSTALKYPEDAQLQDSEAYRMFTKSHFSFFAKAPNMDNFFEALAGSYQIEGNKLLMTVKVDDNDNNVGKTTKWDFVLKEGKLVLEIEGNREVWVKVE